MAAARQVVCSLLIAGSIEEVPAPIENAAYALRTGEDGRVLMLRATGPGLARLVEPGAIAPSLVLIGQETRAATVLSAGTSALPTATDTTVARSLGDFTMRWANPLRATSLVRTMPIRKTPD